jgi:hypothetical protein
MDAEKTIQVLCSCGVHFTIAPGEQRFFLSKGLTLPKKCAPCRAKKKAALNDPATRVAVQKEVQERSPFKELQREIFG